MAVFITGDCHGEFERLNVNNFPEQKEMTKNDVVIICGDFGGIWHRTENKSEDYWLNWLDSKSFTTVFVDGNHENHARLNDFSVKEWNGGKVHELRPSVLHLMRGEVFTIEDKTFFAFGGASSHDISDGILDCKDPIWRLKAAKLDLDGKYMYRVKGLSWWEEELPSQEQMDNGLKNLEKYDYKVDFVITHSPSASIIALLGHGLYKQDILTQYLEEIRVKLDYKKWFAGHMHINKQVNMQDILLYEQIVRIL